jgi:branched-chain amino acid transport system substrate-binding protein
MQRHQNRRQLTTAASWARLTMRTLSTPSNAGRHRSVRRGLCFAALLFIASSCFPAAQTARISIGALVPQSGPDAQTGANMRAAIQVALQEIGYRIAGHEIELHWIDEGGDPTKATANYERAIVRDHIQAGFAGWRSDAAVALMPMIARHQVPHLFGIGATDLINQKFKSDEGRFGYWTTKIYPMPDRIAEAYADAITAAVAEGSFKPITMSVALFAEDTDWGRSVAATMKRSFEGTGWLVKGLDFYPRDMTDFSALLARFRSLDVGVVAGTASIPQAGAAFVKQYRVSGLKALLVVDGLGYGTNWYDATGPASDGVLDQEFVLASPAAQRFSESFRALAGYDPSPFTAGLAYDATTFLVKVLETTAETHSVVDSASIYETVRKRVWSGELTSAGLVNEQYAYRDSTIPDPVTGVGFFVVPVVQYKDGKPQIIWPPPQATAKLKND